MRSGDHASHFSSQKSAALLLGGVPACGEAPGGEAAGLVSSKTSVQDAFLDVSFSRRLVLERRVKRLRRHIWAAGHLHRLGARNGSRERVWFVTLTYRGVSDWVPRHISQCLKRVRHWCKTRGVPFRYVWVAELQQRGALHYHLAIWLPTRLQLPKFDKQGWWPHGMTNRVIAQHAVGYLMKYLSKISPFHEFPRGVRLYGVGGLVRSARDVCAWLNLPSWCKQAYGVGELRLIRGRRVVRQTGEVLGVMYRRSFFPGGMRLIAVGVLPERWADGPYCRLNQSEGPP